MTTLSVPDMTCAHCKASIETALAPLSVRVEVDLATRRVRVEGSKPETLVATLEEIGFPATVVG